MGLFSIFLCFLLVFNSPLNIGSEAAGQKWIVVPPSLNRRVISLWSFLPGEPLDRAKWARGSVVLDEVVQVRRCS